MQAQFPFLFYRASSISFLHAILAKSKTLWHADEFSNTGNINVKILTCCNLQVNQSHSFFTSQVSTFSYDEMFPVICKLELFKNRYTLTSKVYNLRPTITHRFSIDLLTPSLLLTCTLWRRSSWGILEPWGGTGSWVS